MSNLNRAIRTSISINFIGRYSNILVQLLVTGTLARLLNPKDFGMIAVLSVLVTFFSFLSEMGLGPAIVQFQQLRREQLATLQWLTVLVGSALAAIFMLGGPFLAAFYREPRYTGISLYLGATIALSCWGIVPLALLRKAQRFRAIVVIEVAAALLSGTVAIWSAWSGGGVIALAVKSTSYAAFMLVFSLFACRFNPLIRPDFRGLSTILAYSGYQFVFNLINYFTRNLDKLMIGRIMGSHALGLYDMSYRLMLMPIANLTQVVSPALQPIYAAQQQQKDAIFSSYRDVVRVLTIVGGYAGIGCFVCAPEIIHLAYGSKWGSAVPIFAVLSLSIVVQVVLSSIGAIYQAIGRTDLLSLSGALSAVTSIAAMALGIRAGDLVVFSWLLAGSFLVNAVQGFHILARYGFHRSLRDLFGPTTPCMIGIAVMLAACHAGLAPAANTAFQPLALAAKIAGVTLAYLGWVKLTGDLDFFCQTVLGRPRAGSARRNARSAAGEANPTRPT
ncbi:lipopolysaccharide biosynthesis protein [Burkholderia pyrrocinia]|uniref:lipopolysaccharide biosynthesis protein n=1 Tax=Burkholderia pyrrocinia TaxID=60550 RepID=UPI00069E07BF|nr:lipopolysaccharide biosynthesis protein [Burkholderia pyrrocinia]